jgi:serine O-acetyltransferase
VSGARESSEAFEHTQSSAHAAGGDSFGLSAVVDELRRVRLAFDGEHRHARRHAPLPSRDALIRVAAGLRAALFPSHFGPSDLSDEGADSFVGYTLDRTLGALHEQIRRGLCAACTTPDECANCKQRAATMTRAFAEQLPAIRAMLEKDVRAAYDGDPAATSLEEAIFSYPGVTAITHHRLAHPLYKLGVPLIPRILAEISHSETGIDIHPGAEIGESFFIDHGTGVVIGETCRIGKNVRIYQGVTLGAKSFPLDEQGRPIKGVPRHPIVEDNVIVYSGATILGRVTIGASSSIGGNVWLTRSVPAHTTVTQAQSRSECFDDGAGI